MDFSIFKDSGITGTVDVNCWITAPDGELYQRFYGNIKVLSAFDVTGIKNLGGPHANFIVSVDDCIFIPGCKVEGVTIINSVPSNRNVYRGKNEN